MSFTYSGFKGGKNCVQFYGSGGVEMIMKKYIMAFFGTRDFNSWPV